eukprot:1879410-Pleurochrysis_carterae.AAC.4
MTSSGVAPPTRKTPPAGPDPAALVAASGPRHVEVHAVVARPQPPDHGRASPMPPPQRRASAATARRHAAAATAGTRATPPSATHGYHPKPRVSRARVAAARARAPPHTVEAATFAAPARPNAADAIRTKRAARTARCAAS